MVARRYVARARSEQHDQRPQPFPAMVDDVMGDLIDQRDIAAEAPVNGAVDVFPVGSDNGADGLERSGG
jgi:hypothetical protein